MGRRKAGAAPYNVRDVEGIAYASTTIAGRRFRESLGIPWRTDRRGAREIAAAAASWYAALLAGRVVERHARIVTADTIEDLVAMWLVHIDETRERSASMFTSHGRRFLDVFGHVRDLFADNAPQTYALARLKKALRRTVQKELSSLANFYAWALFHQHVVSVPPRYEIPDGQVGRRTGLQREKAVEVTDAEARAIAAALPEWSAPQRGWRAGDELEGRYRVRAVFVFAYETGLRPSTIARLEVPRHWAPGRKTLLITEAIDKAKFGRELPLSAAAVQALQECATGPGLIFGRHDYRKALRRAALAVLGADRGKAFARYDFRHARATHVLTASQDLLATAYLLGHKQVSTTNRYLHPALRDAERAVRLVELGRDSADKSKPGPLLDPESPVS